MNGRRLLVLGLLLAIPGAQAVEELRMGSNAQLERVVAPTAAGVLLEFDASVLLDVEAPVYAKVLKSDGNPVYDNGSVDGPGWWTEFLLMEDAGPRSVGKTNGSILVELGVFNTTHPVHLLLRVHVPPGALAHSGELRANYVVARRAPVNTSTSGASLNPSVLLQARIVVDAGQRSVEGAESESWPTWIIPGAAALGLAGAGLAMGIARRRTGGSKP